MPAIPQDIIDSIIDELRGDDATLKQCMTVSRAFHLPSRRNLFFVIRLDTCITIRQLHHLLASTPHIASDIRELEITVSWRNGNLSAATSQTTLSDIFGMVPTLKRLWLGPGKSGPLVGWDDLSLELQSVLVKLFESPSLITAICVSDDFPLSILHAAASVKSLRIFDSFPHNNDQKQITLPHLEVLGIMRLYMTAPIVAGLSVPNLRRLLLLEHDDEQDVGLVQRVIDSSAGSLEYIWWDYSLSLSRRSM